MISNSHSLVRSKKRDVASWRRSWKRKRILAETARKKWLVAAAHHPFPGLGHVRNEGKGYAWVPVEYGDLPSAKK